MLKIVDPMTSDFIRETNWIDIRKYKHLRITSFSDCNLALDVCFSHNGMNEGPLNSFAIFANQWKTYRVDIILPFIKLRVIRSENEINTMLVINTLGRYSQVNEQSKEQPVLKQESEIEEHSEVRRAKSPFRSFVARKKSGPLPVAQKVEVNDARLPNFIPKNSLLVGSFAGQISTIPPPTPNVDCYLCYIDNSFIWQPISDNKKITWKV